jgi:hypothetical protein
MHEFTWDVTCSGGHTIVYKQLSKMGVRTRKDARVAAARDAELTRAQTEPHVCVIDVAGIKLSPKVYVYCKCMLRENPPRPLHTYVVNAPKWATKVHAVMSKLMAPEDVATTSLHAGPFSEALLGEL